ncbi:MAG TPA: hypothetical protein PK869_13815 [Candidatus Hydrogenedentes bacterium]|nr:hypothetical protein [Candidatus Hydrogenedentota bacterium]
MEPLPSPTALGGNDGAVVPGGVMGADVFLGISTETFIGAT